MYFNLIVANKFISIPIPKERLKNIVPGVISFFSFSGDTELTLLDCKLSNGSPRQKCNKNIFEYFVAERCYNPFFFNLTYLRKKCISSSDREVQTAMLCIQCKPDFALQFTVNMYICMTAIHLQQPTPTPSCFKV